MRGSVCYCGWLFGFPTCWLDVVMIYDVGTGFGLLLRLAALVFQRAG